MKHIATFIFFLLTSTIARPNPEPIGSPDLPPPAIISFSPSDAQPGEQVTITGSDFDNASEVIIGGIKARSFQVVSTNTLLAVIDSIAGGNVSVKTPAGITASPGFYNGPVIVSLSSYKAGVGTRITINGIHFGNQPGGKIVRFGGIHAVVISSASNSITVEVPRGAAFSPVSVTSQKLTTYSDRPFLPYFAAADTLVTANSFLPKTTIVNQNRFGQAQGIGIGDLNGDGTNDLVTGSPYGQISIYKNGGTIANTLYQFELDGRDNEAQVIVNDVDGDGKLDLITSSYNDILIFKNTSTLATISFREPVQIVYSLYGVGRIMLTDIDGDGRPDITAHKSGVIIFQNLSTSGHILFSEAQKPVSLYTEFIAYGDIDGDKKPEMVLENNYRCAVLKNTSVPGRITFNDPYFIKNIPPLRSVYVADLDGDDLQDILMATIIDRTIVVARNVSSPGSIEFETPQKFAAVSNIYDRTMHDLDGDGKPDFVGVSSNTDKLCILINRSTAGDISFAEKIEIDTDFVPASVEAGDMDNDGKPDIIVITSNTRAVSVYKNRIGEVDSVPLCPPVGSTIIAANKVGSTYHWQVDTGQGFTNITINSNYDGADSTSLSLINVPSSWNGYKYRCLVDGVAGSVSQLSFKDIWTGEVSNEWENVANWNCGLLPDINTDVIIYNGTVNINADLTIRSLKVGPGGIINVKPGVQLTILK